VVWWAGQRKADCKLKHSFPEHDFKLGDTIFWTPTDAIRTWADEEKYYTYATNTFAPPECVMMEIYLLLVIMTLWAIMLERDLIKLL